MILQILLHLLNRHTLSRKSQAILIYRLFYEIHCPHIRNRKCNKFHINIKSVFVNLFISLSEQFRLHSCRMHLNSLFTDNLFKLIQLIILYFFKRMFLPLLWHSGCMIDPGIIRRHNICIALF